MREVTVGFPDGIDGSSGQPIAPPDLKTLLGKHFAKEGKRVTREVIDGVNPQSLKQAGWGVIVASSDELSSDALAALQPLLDLRQREAGPLYKEYLGKNGYLAGEDKFSFLDRQGAGPGRVDPRKVPYYLLLVGSPDSIPYDFQYGLDVHHAVGRICFDTVEEYAAYARNVVAAEARIGSSLQRKVGFFGPCQDEGTRLSNEELLTPVIQSVREGASYEIQEYRGEKASKEALARLLGGGETPDLLFTAGHGVYYEPGHERQRTHQGALVCQGWPGRGHTPKPEHVFAAEDLNGPARLLGLIAFLFACNSAGTPVRNDFASRKEDWWSVSPRPFVSRLAQRLLGHPDGGALAVIGHVEQVWQHSFRWRQTGAQPQAFVDTVNRLLGGSPLGWAMEPLNQRFTDLAAELGELLKAAYLGGTLDQEALAELWIASQDARNYVIVGDPAVRLFGRKSALRG